MKLRLHKEQPSIPSSFGITWALMGLVLVGAAISIHLTTDSRWMEWHLSRLGEGGHLSSAIFNFTISLAAVIFTVIAMRMSDEIQTSEPHDGARTLRNLLIAAAMCWIGVACFPFDTFPLIHNIFGYGEAFILMIAMLGLWRICPRFSTRTYYVGVGAAVVVGLLLVLFLTIRLTTLLFVELVGEALLFAWLLSMTADMRRIKRKPVVTLYK